MIVTQTRITCDTPGCGAHCQITAPTPKHAIAHATQRQGWTHHNGIDTCGPCSRGAPPQPQPATTHPHPCRNCTLHPTRARGLCVNCYQRMLYTRRTGREWTGTPPLPTPAERHEEYNWLRSQGEDARAAARQVGIALSTALRDYEPARLADKRSAA